MFIHFFYFSQWLFNAFSYCKHIRLCICKFCLVQTSLDLVHHKAMTSGILRIHHTRQQCYSSRDLSIHMGQGFESHSCIYSWRRLNSIWEGRLLAMNCSSQYSRHNDPSCRWQVFCQICTLCLWAHIGKQHHQTPNELDHSEAMTTCNHCRTHRSNHYCFHSCFHSCTLSRIDMQLLLITTCLGH